MAHSGTVEGMIRAYTPSLDQSFFEARSDRDRAVEEPVFGAQCERFMDHWYGGSAMLSRLRRVVAVRSADDEPRGEATDDLTTFLESPYLSDDARSAVQGLTELIATQFVRALCEARGVLYSSDDLERIFLTPEGTRDMVTSEVIASYHSPGRGALREALHQIDAWLPYLRTCGLLVGYVVDLEELSYQCIPPHWFQFLARPDMPTDQRLAYACAYAESHACDDAGVPYPEAVWTCYVRPALPGDPSDAPTRDPFFASTGRLVRYRSSNAIAPSPWPIPERDSDMIIEDGLNPLVMKGGFLGASRVWCPLVLHTSEALIDGFRLPVADHLATFAEEMDLALSSALHTANVQSAGIPVKTGAGELPRVIGPMHPVEIIDPAGSFTFASPNAKAMEHLELVHTLAKFVGVMCHLPSDTFSYQPPSIETGPAKRMRSADLITERGKRTISAERAEHIRFSLERVLHNGNHKKASQLPLDTRMEIHWGELAIPVDWGHRLQEMAQELSLGISGVVDLLMERHAVSREEAMRRLQEIVDEKISERRATPPAPDTPTGDIPVPDSGQPAR